MTVADYLLIVGVVIAILLSLYALNTERHGRWRTAAQPTEREDMMQEDIDSMRDEIGRLRAEVEWMKAALRILSAQLTAAGITPAVSVEAVPTLDTTAHNMSALRRKMHRAFTVDGIDSLAFDLGLDSGDIAGETKDARIIALLEAVSQRGRLNDLLLLLKSERPGTRWTS